MQTARRSARLHAEDAIRVVVMRLRRRGSPKSEDTLAATGRRPSRAQLCATRDIVGHVAARTDLLSPTSANAQECLGDPS